MPNINLTEKEILAILNGLSELTQEIIDGDARGFTKEIPDFISAAKKIYEASKDDYNKDLSLEIFNYIEEYQKELKK